MGQKEDTEFVRQNGDLWDEDTESKQGIEFVCKEEDYGKIPEPVPANSAIPDWYEDLSKNFEVQNGEETHKVKTVTQCMPFLDAMTTGWIIPLADDLHVTTNEDGKSEFSTSFDKPLTHRQVPEQLGSAISMTEGDTILQFRGYWYAVAPEGYSLLVTSPINRVETRFEPFSGIVDIDNFLTMMNSVVLWEEGAYEGTIEKGTPVAQVIPFKRDSILNDAVIRPFSDKERERDEQQDEAYDSYDTYYRDVHWEPKEGARNISPE